MTITVAPARNELTANAGQTIFNYTFKIFSITDLNVYITPAGQNANDSTDLTTAYTVLGVGDEDGGTITLTTGATLNDLITIVSNTPSSRTTDYQNNGDFRPDTVNADFDRVVSLVKKIEDSSNRSLLSPQSKQGPKPLSLPEPVIGEILRWKDDLSGLENISFNELPSGVFPVDRLALNYSTLAAWQNDTSAQLGDVVTTAERTAGKGGGATGDVIASGTENGFNIVKHNTLPLSWELRPKAFASLREYGCIDGAVVNAVLNWQAAADSGLPVLLDGKFLLKSRVTEMHSLIGADRELSEVVIDGTFTDSVVFRNARHYTLFHNFLMSMRDSPETDIIAIHNFDGRHSDIHAITIRGNLKDGMGVLTEKGDATAFTFGHFIRNCNITGQKIGTSYTDTVTASSIVDNDFIGVQSGGAPAIAGSRAVEIFPTSGNGFDIQMNEIEGYDEGVYSEGTYVKITNNRFETNNKHIKLVRGAGNAKIWSSILDNKYLGLGIVEFPENNTDFVTRFEELGMRITTAIPVVGNGQDYHGSGTSLTQTFKGAFPSAAQSGDFIRVGTFSLKAQFQQATLRGTIAVLRTGVTQRGELDFKLNVFQNVAMASTPGGTLTQWGDRLSGNEIFAVVTLLNANTTDVEIWVQTGDNGPQIIYEISSVSSLNNYLPDNTGTFQAALPAGPQIGPGVFRVFDNLAIDNIPTASGGLVSGTIWSNAGVLNIIP